MEEQNDLYQFKGLTKGAKVNSKALAYGRYLIGSIDTCGIQIQHSSINPIHAVLEVSANGIKIYSLNVESSVLVNGEKQAVSDLKIGDTLKVGQVVLDFSKYDRSQSLPTIPSSEVPKENNKSKTKSVITETSVKAPHLIYPFDQSYNFDSSEYIFEDNKNIYPIFKYDLNKYAVEIIIIHKKRIFSVDYVPEIDGIYRLAGIGKSSADIEYPYLGESDVAEFIECRGGSFFVNKLADYSVQLFSDTPGKLEGSTISLEQNDVISFQKDDLSIVVRNVDSPPDVTPPPLLPRDKSLLLMIFLAFLLVTVPMYFIYNLKIDKEKLEKEKAPERIAKILYNKKQFQKVEKPKAAPKKETKATPKKVPKVTKPAKPKAGPKIKTPPKPKPIKKAPSKPPTKTPPAPGPKKNVSKPKTTTKTKSVGRKSTNTTTKSPTPTKKGTVDVYRNNNFKSTISSLLAKGGEFKGVKTQGSSSGSFSATGSAGVSGGGGVKTATVSDQLGSPTGSRNGVEGFNSGAEGISDGNKTFYTAGIPSETVIVGSMDPDIIRKILRDHIPQFRFCYQKELDRINKKVQGIVKMVFTIGASGSVTRAGVQGATGLPGSVKRCVVNVLRGIQFPRPLGGGQVEVKQPINFYPRTK